MGGKVIVLLGLFLAMVLLISSEVASATEAVDTTGDPTAVNDAKDQYGGGYPGGGGGGGGGGGYPGGGHGGGRGCRYGCCGRSYKGGCRCCTFAGQKPNAVPQN